MRTRISHQTCFSKDRLSKKQFKHFIKSPTALVMVIKKHKLLIAAAVILFRKNSTIVRLYSIAVDPDYRRLGIAKMLNDKIIHYSLKHRDTEIRLEVRKDNPQAINFYLKNNYQAFGEYKNFYEDGEDALRMRKILSS